MPIPYGSLVNALAIIAGATLGTVLRERFPENIRTIVFQALGLCVLVVGFQMALASENLLVLIFSVLLGGICGEILHLEQLFERLGNRFKAAVRSKNERFTDGLIMASLIFCIGAMAVVGSFEEGINHDPTILYTKSILDGFASIALAAAYGTGVIFSFLPVLIYQGALTLFAGAFQDVLPPHVIAQLSATGGVLIIGIGIVLLEIKQIRLSNLLPALVFAVVLSLIFG